MNLKIAFFEAIEDFQHSWNLREVWISLAQDQSDKRYSKLASGPFWLSLHYLVFVAAIVLIFSYGQTIDMYFVAHVSAGLFMWLPLIQAMRSGTSIFLRGKSSIHGVSMPLFVPVMRRVWETLIEWFYLFPFCIALLAWAGHWPQITWLLAIPSIAVVVMMLPTVIIIIGSICAVNPPMRLIIGRMLTVLMFVTPVFWIVGMDDSSGRGLFRKIFSEWNPFAHYLRIVRDPLINGELPVVSLGICIIITLILWLSALLMLGLFQRKILLPK